MNCFSILGMEVKEIKIIYSKLYGMVSHVTIKIYVLRQTFFLHLALIFQEIHMEKGVQKVKVN